MERIHSRIRFVTLVELHRGQDREILARRHELYERARQANPQRRSGQTRNWEPIGMVLLNPNRDERREKHAA